MFLGEEMLLKETHLFFIIHLVTSETGIVTTALKTSIATYTTLNMLKYLILQNYQHSVLYIFQLIVLNCILLTSILTKMSPVLNHKHVLWQISVVISS